MLRAMSESILKENRREGTTVQSIRFDQLKGICIPIPPLAEQKRIVAKVEELLGRVKIVRERLAKVPVTLKRFRQAVLAAACSGRLTEEWREGRCPATRAADVTETGPFELPARWRWVRFEGLINSIRSGSTAVPKLDETAFPILRSSSVRPGVIDLADSRYVELKDSDNEANFLHDGDLLFTRLSGSLEYVANCAVVRSLGKQRIQYPDRLFRVRLRDQANASYIEFIFAAPYLRKAVGELAKSSAGHQRVSQGGITDQMVPLPQPEERDEIVRRVEALFKLADAIEKRVAAAMARADKLTQSILAKAFRGELVSTEAELARAEGREYEPASVLLERIRKDKDAFDSEAQARREGGRMKDENRRAKRRGVGGKEQQGEGMPEAKPATVEKRSGRSQRYRQGAVVSYVVQHLHKSPNFGRTQLEKILNLAQTHLGIELDFEFKRQAAGPFDEAVYKVESLAAKKGWFTTKKRDLFGVTYHPGEKIEEECVWAERILGGNRGAFDALLALMGRMDTDQAELLATVYAAWNDMLIDGRPVTDDTLIAEVYGWHERKKRFGRERILKCVRWMKENGWVPRGTGQRTRASALHERQG